MVDTVRTAKHSATIRNAMVVLLGIILSTIVGLLTAGVWVLNQGRIDNPHYQQMVVNKDALADVLPPPEYIIESCLVASRMFSATGADQLQELKRQGDQLKAEYLSRHDYWQRLLPEGEVKTELCDASYAPALAFYRIRDEEFIPAIMAGEHDRAAALMDGRMMPQYQAHRHAIDGMVESSRELSQAIDDTIKVLDARERIIIASSALGLLVSTLLCAWLVRRHIVRPISDDLVRSEARFRSLFEQAPLGIAISREGRMLLVNQSGLQLFGSGTQEQLQHRPLPEFYAPEVRGEVEERIRRRQQGLPEMSEYDSIGMRLDGTRFDMHVLVNKVELEDGPAMVGYLTDITQRKRIESELRESENRYRSLCENNIVGIWQIDLSGMTAYVNRAMCEMLELYSAHDLEGETFHRYFTRESLETMAVEHAKRQQGVASVYEIELIGRRARRRRVVVSGAAILGDSGAITGNIATFTDITERHRAQQALIEGEERYRLLIANAPDGIMLVDPADGMRIIEANTRAGELFGCSRDELLTMTPLDISADQQPDGRSAQESIAQHQLLLAGGAPVVKEWLFKRGHGGAEFLCDLRLIQLTIGDRRLIRSSIMDITERRKLEANHRRLSAIVEASDDAIISTTLDGIIMTWNAGASRLLGYSADEAIGQPMAMCIPTERQGEDDRLLARIAEGASIGQIDTIRMHRDGRRLEVSVTISPIRDGLGRIIGASKIARDISERKQAEIRLQSQFTRIDLLNRIARAIAERQDLPSIFQVVVRSLEDSLRIDFCCACLYQAERHCLTVSNVGIRSEQLAEALSMPPTSTVPIDENGLYRCVSGELVYEPDIAGVRFPFPQRLAAGGLRALVAVPLMVEGKAFGVIIAARLQPNCFSSGECEFLRQLGEHVALAAHQAQLHTSLQRAYDDLHQSQQTAMQQERLRALGQMAAGIAHDINNALSPLAIYSDMLLDGELGLNERTRNYLEIMNRAIDDVTTTISRLGDFYRSRDQQQQHHLAVDVNEMAQHVIDLTRARWSDMSQLNGIEIHMVTDLELGIPPIMGVAGDLREGLTNLVFNAVDAMPDGGTITIATRLRNAAVDGQGRPLAQQVAIEVNDTGLGMDEETRRRCLEPFFTTKGERGTGLGLAMVYGMVRRHHGEIEIDSVVGAGTTIRLRFPLAGQGEASARQAIDGRKPPPLRILVVDDDPVLLSSIRDLLKIDGHQVVTENGGAEAIEHFCAALAQGEPFAVVITDLGMPQVDGRQVARAVKAASPATPVIMLTGWGSRMVAEGDIPEHVDTVLSKPPKLQELRTTLKQYGPTGDDPTSSPLPLA